MLSWMTSHVHLPPSLPPQSSVLPAHRCYENPCLGWPNPSHCLVILFLKRYKKGPGKNMGPRACKLQWLMWYLHPNET